MVKDHSDSERKEGCILFNDALNTLHSFSFSQLPPTQYSDRLIVIEGRKEMFYLMMHSTHFIYGYVALYIW